LEFTQERKQDNGAETNKFTAPQHIIQEGTNTGKMETGADRTERRERERETERQIDR
jgi:hypothetical protein